MTMILDGTNGAFLPTWTTATRPASPANGEIGYNSTTGQLDQYVSGAWSSVPTAGASQATATALGTVYAKQTTSGASPYLTAFGYNAGVSTTGVNNTAVGFQASYRNTSGTANTSLGYNAGYQVTTGTNNVSIGDSVLGSNGGGVTGNYNTGVGSVALTSLSSGSNNTAIGYNALYSSDTGTSNVAVGYQSLYTSTVSNATAIGYQAGYKCSDVSTGNSFLGYQAGYNQTSAYSSTFIGLQAGYSNVTGNSNTYNGHNAGYYQTGGSNTAVGVQALLGASGTSTGTNNTGIGFNALYACTSGYNNVALGYQSLNANNSGYLNTCIGTVAGLNITSGNNIVCVGYYSGQTISTGSTSTYIGSQTSASAAGVTGEVLVSSYGAAGKGVNTAFITGGGGPCYAGNNSATWAVISDQRLKKNIVDNNVGLDKIVQIQVRNFEYRTEDEVTDLPKNQVIKKEGVQLGAIAQELQQILPDCVTERSTGVLSVDSDNIMWHMINAIKELNAKVIALETRLGA
jgi:hypothetical protein